MIARLPGSTSVLSNRVWKNLNTPAEAPARNIPTITETPPVSIPAAPDRNTTGTSGITIRFKNNA